MRYFYLTIHIIKMLYHIKYISYFLPLLLTGCISAATFGMNEEVYQRNLVSIKNKTIPFSMKYIHWEGNPADIGKQKADYIKKNPVIIQRLEDRMSLSGIIMGNPPKVKENLEKFFPEIYAEMKSFSDAHGFSLEKLMEFYGAHFFIGGCSVYTNSRPTPFLARNYDWPPTLVDGIISSTESTKGRYSSIMISESIFGAVCGINEHGLVIAISAITSNKRFPVNGGISMPIIVRGVLDKAKDVNSAISLLKKLPHTTACNYSLLDKTGKMAVVEVASGTILVREKSGQDAFLTATNHFQLISNKTENVKVLPNSLRRRRSIEEFHKKYPEADIDAIFSFMGNSREGPAMNNYSLILGTMWTIVYIPQKKEMIIRIGLSGDKKSFHIGHKRETILKGNLIDLPPKLSDYF